MIPELHLVMHGVAIKKHGSALDIATVTGLAPDRVNNTLAQATASGRVAEVDGKYLLTPAGHMILAGEYSRFYASLRTDKGFIKAYDRFESINKDLKQIVTDWQTIAVGAQRLPNDHRDRAYDEKIINRLGDLHERFEPIFKRLIASVARLCHYETALNVALHKAEDGEIAWVSEVKLASYHTVWFELHEDLLRLLGRTRDE
ncbi:MAG: hypothetical protein ACREXT_12965 [Gammaproteobacteria bacterium]